MRLRIIEGSEGIPHVVTTDGELVDGVTVIQVRHEVNEPVRVTIMFIDMEATRQMLARGLVNPVKVPELAGSSTPPPADVS